MSGPMPDLALRGHHADHLEGLIADADDLADRIGVDAEERVADRLAEHGHLGRARTRPAR